jgi:hypothetical protein
MEVLKIMSILASLIARPIQYLDPGSGSLFIQIILGAVLGLAVVVRVFWSNSKSFFTKGKKTAAVTTDPNAIVEDPTAVVIKIPTQDSNDKKI